MPQRRGVQSRAPLAALALSLALLAGCRTGPALPGEEWATITLAGAPLGYIHTITRPTDVPPGCIETISTTEWKFQRLNIALTQRLDTRYMETSAGKTLSIRSSKTSAGTSDALELDVGDGRAEMVLRRAGDARRQTIDWDGSAVGPLGQTLLWRRFHPKPGAIWEVSAFSPELRRVTTQQFRIEGRETLEIRGARIECVTAVMTDNSMPGIVTRVWLDSDGGLVKSRVDALGGVEVVRASREEALRGFEQTLPPDLLNGFAVAANRRISQPERVTEALYRLRAAESALKGLDIEDRRQSATERSDGMTLLRVRALGDAETPAAPPGPEYLIASEYLQSDDPEIVRIAREQTEGLAGAAEKAERLRVWVNKAIRRKDMGVGFASAKEALQLRQGDCTEHAVLLAALLRAANIPSRVVIGLTYWREQFAYHMWTEAFLNDWTALDATLPTGPVDACHIKLAAMTLNTGEARDAFSGLAMIMGQIKVEIVELKP